MENTKNINELISELINLKNIVNDQTLIIKNLNEEVKNLSNEIKNCNMHLKRMQQKISYNSW